MVSGSPREYVGIVLVSLTVFCLLNCYRGLRNQDTSNQGPTPGHVKTAVGEIQGTLISTSQGLEVEQYLGIPFAEKPIGKLRYSDPVALKKLPNEPYNATSHQFSCMQSPDTTFGEFQGSAMWNPPNPVSEDCLYLNLWVPKERERLKKLPVMVWIYGGGFFAGSNALWVYDGKELAAYTGMIIASFNYRVNTFGYLSTGDGRIKGNFGMKDQVMALKWIKDNIESFGGDPDQITIFGESSGASSAGLHMMSNHSKGLFKRAIFESGSPDAHWSYMSVDQAKQRSSSFFANVNCTMEETDALLDCLRAKPADTILANEWVTSDFMVFPWGPTIDGDFMTDTPVNLLKKGEYEQKEALLGVNKDEGTYWILYVLEGFSKDHESLQNYSMFRRGVDTIYWDLPETTREEMKTLYTPADYQTNPRALRDSLDKVCGDRSFTCPTKELTSLYTEAGFSTYFYYLSYRASTEVWPPWMGVIHGAEIQWVFGMPLNSSRGYTQAEVEFSKHIMSYWANFARTGNPNGDGLPNWPQYSPDKREFIEFRDAPQDFVIGTELRDEYCDKWRDVNKQLFS